MSDVKQAAPETSRSSKRVATKGAASRDSSASAVAKVFQILAVVIMIVCSGLLTLLITVNYQSFRLYDARADAKSQQLAALQSQHDDMTRRLQFSQLPKGREQVLLEHGYLKPGQRILLFPAEKTAAPNSDVNSSATSSTRSSKIDEKPVANSLAKPAAENDGEIVSDKAQGNALSRWWNDVNRASSSPPTSAAPTSAAPTSAAPTSAAPTSAAPTSAAPVSTETP